jgi:hypothetical protein
MVVASGCTPGYGNRDELGWISAFKDLLVMEGGGNGEAWFGWGKTGRKGTHIPCLSGKVTEKSVRRLGEDCGFETSELSFRRSFWESQDFRKVQAFEGGPVSEKRPRWFLELLRWTLLPSLPHVRIIFFASVSLDRQWGRQDWKHQGDILPDSCFATSWIPVLLRWDFLLKLELRKHLQT